MSNVRNLWNAFYHDKGDELMTIKELRTAAGMTQQAFADYFDIPKRSIENWEGSKSEPPEYLVKLIEYKLKHERKI